MSDMAADSIIGTGLKRCVHRILKLPDQRPLRPPTSFLHDPPLSRQIDWSNRAAAIRYCGDLYHSNIVTGAALYDLHLVNGSDENNFQAN